MNHEDFENGHPMKERLWRVVFEAETPLGKFFDVILMWSIVLSVAAVMLETVDAVAIEWGGILQAAEWFFTIIFTLEYLLRLYLVRRPLRYATSFFGIVDLLSCLPTYIGIFFAGTHSLLVIRILRLLRMFRVLKMVGHVQGANVILVGLRKSRAKITVFFFSVLLFAVLAGTLMYLVEGREPETRFTSIPMSIYFAVVTSRCPRESSLQECLMPIGEIRALMPAPVAELMVISQMPNIAVAVVSDLAKKQNSALRTGALSVTVGHVEIRRRL